MKEEQAQKYQKIIKHYESLKSQLQDLKRFEEIIKHCVEMHDDHTEMSNYLNVHSVGKRKKSHTINGYPNSSRKYPVSLETLKVLHTAVSIDIHKIQRELEELDVED